MADLTSTDKLKLEKLLEMGGGYVLDFSNRTFEQFVLENTGKDIYSKGYDVNGTSKANRLRTFWEINNNAIVGKLLEELLNRWKLNKLYKDEFITLIEQSLYDECILIAQRLISNEIAKKHSNQSQTIEINKKKQLQLLLSMFDDLSTSNDPQKRGYLLQNLLNQLFLIYEIPVAKSFQRNAGGEQLDGAFSFHGWYYLVECKWTKKRTEPKELDSLLGKVNRGGRQSMGLFLSIEGWSENVVPLLKQNPDKCIILMDGYDLRCVLADAVDLEVLLTKKIENLNENSEPFFSSARLFAQKG
jgi:hypothetical protein